MKPLSLTSQLRLSALLPVFLCALIFSCVYTYEAFHTARQQRIQLSQTYLTQLIPLVQFTMAHQPKQFMQELINASMMHSEIQSINLFDPQGNSLAYHGHPLPFPSHKPSPILNTLFPTTDTIVFAPIFDNLDASNNTSKPLLGWIGIKLDPHPEQLVLYQHLLIAFIMSLICLLGSWGMHAFGTQQILASIVRLRRSMKQILCGEFETEIKVQSSGPMRDIELGCEYLQKHYLESVHDLNHHIEIATADLQQSLELLEEKNIELSLDKKKTEEKILQQSEFVANMSHEIRTPMNGLLGFTNVLLDTNLTPLQRDYVTTIRSSAGDLLNIINDILDYSKIDAGKLHLEAIPIDLRYVIDEVMTLTAPIAYKKNLNFFTLTEANVPKIVVGDSLRIKQILSNLIVNAIKFTDQGQVFVHTRVEDYSPTHYELLFKITDTGIGISPEEQHRLFNAFYQADPTISRRFGGSGLGLVICKKLSEAMEGQIHIQSKPQEGTTFSVRLRLQKLHAYETEKATELPAQKEKILCIDPIPLSLTATEQNCLFLHYQPICLSDISQLSATLAANEDIKLIILNIHEQQHLRIPPQLEHLSIPCMVLSNSPITSLPLTHAVNLLNPIQTQKLDETISSMLTRPFESPHPYSKLANLRQQLQAHQLHLLIAEDNPVNRLLLDTLLSGLCQLTIVNDGQEAIQACQQRTYDLLILDLQMPKLSGEEVALQLRTQLPNYLHTPIVFISANAMDVSPATLKELRIRRCLQKPFDEETLLHEILENLTKTSPAPIDWEKCQRNMSGKIDLAKACLKQFVDEFETHRKTLKTLLKEKDNQGIANTAHTIKGACGFLAIPILKELADELETQAQQQSIAALKPLVKRLFEEMDRIKAYDAHHSLSS